MNRPVDVTPKRRIVIAALIVLASLSLLALPACCCRPRGRENGPQASPPPPIASVTLPPPPGIASSGPTLAEMRNVDFRVDPTITLHIHTLRGEMHSIQPGGPVDFDDKRSFVVRIGKAEIGLDGHGLSDLMNHYVFAYPGAPLRDLQISTAGRQLRQEGILHKVIDIPFVMLADVSATPDGRIRIHPTKIEICNLNGKGLMKALGVTLQKMIKVPRERGVALEGNDLLIDPAKVLPPPAIEGHLSAVEVSGSELLQKWDDGRAASPLPLPVAGEPNYMYYRGGTLRMGKLYMVQADMMVLDTDRSDAFDFFIDRYNDQLVEGFTRNRPDYGLTVFMRDFSDLGTAARPGERLSP